MYILIIVAFVVLLYVIRKLINDGVDNLIEGISSKVRNKKLQQQGSQSLADRYAGMNNSQGHQPQQQSQQPKDPQNPFQG